MQSREKTVDHFRAILVSRGEDKKQSVSTTELSIDDLMEGDVTVAVEAMTFIAPVKVGDILCVYCAVDRVGKTSITIGIEAWVKRERLGDRVKVTDGHFVYVALGEDGQKRVIGG
jgi:acyl-CoA thioesterase YciA